MMYMYGDKEDKITLDKHTFKTLASDTRVGLLKSLNVRRKTLSELSKEHKMSVSTIKEHLDHLRKADLIVQKDDGHKWKYYELTRKGRAVLNPEERKIWILLSLSTIAVIAAGIDALTGAISRIFLSGSAMFMGATMAESNAADTLSQAKDMMVRAPNIPEAVGSGASEAVTDTANTLSDASLASAAQIPWVHILIIIIFAALALYFLYRLKNKKKAKI